MEEEKRKEILITLREAHVLEVMDYIKSLVGDGHMSAMRFCAGFMEYTANQCGMMAPIILEVWKIKSSDDIGKLVYELVKKGIVFASEDDNPEDFNGLFTVESYWKDKDWFADV